MPTGSTPTDSAKYRYLHPYQYLAALSACHSCCDRHLQPLQPPNRPLGAHAPTPQPQSTATCSSQHRPPVATRCHFAGLLPGAVADTPSTPPNRILPGPWPANFSHPFQALQPTRPPTSRSRRTLTRHWTHTCCRPLIFLRVRAAFLVRLPRRLRRNSHAGIWPPTLILQLSRCLPQYRFEEKVCSPVLTFSSLRTQSPSTGSLFFKTLFFPFLRSAPTFFNHLFFFPLSSRHPRFFFLLRASTYLPAPRRKQTLADDSQSNRRSPNWS